MNWTDEPMFDMPQSRPVKRAKTLRELEREGRASVTRYHVKQRVPCDECIVLLQEAGGKGPYARSARWRASVRGRVLLLCNEHADSWREEQK